MKRVRALFAQLRRGKQVAMAFLRMSLSMELSYPVSLLIRHVSPLVTPLLFFFVATLVPQSSDQFGGDYFTFVMVGLIANQMLQAGLASFGSTLNSALQQGQFEMLLVEPVRWRLLPFGMVLFTLITQTINTALIVLLAVLLGAEFIWGGAPAALAVLILGMTATLGIGILSASVRVLAKRSDPLLTLYQMAAMVLAGVFFPLDALPAFARFFSWLIPHTYVIGAMRKALLPETAALDIELAPAVLALAAFNLAILPLSLWLFGRSLEFGRKLGVLSGY